MSEQLPADEQTYDVTPQEQALGVGKICARALFRANDEPSSLTLTEEQISLVCASAVQTVFNTLKGEWQ